MFALALAALIQASPSPEPTAPLTPATSATLPPEPSMIRRMPASQPRLRTGDVVILNSGSTNARGYTIVVHSDFSADVAASGEEPRPAVVGARQAKWLFAKVRAAMPLSALPVPRCMKSASFGTTLRISYQGATTPDLSCGGDATARELSRTAAVIESRLR